MILEFTAAIRQSGDDRFPCLRLAYSALRAGGTVPVVLNAANEIAVGAFLDHKLGFMAIPRVIERAMQAHVAEPVSTLQAVRRADAWARASIACGVGSAVLLVASTFDRGHGATQRLGLLVTDAWIVATAWTMWRICLRSTSRQAIRVPISEGCA